MALGLDDLRVGLWTHPDVPTGCTVILPPDGSLGAIAVGGSSPGTREAITLSGRGKVEVCHGIVLSGGSAYGLATADGVVSYLEEQGVGYPVGDSGAIVPIVGAAILLDASVAVRRGRPDAEAGYAACRAATTGEPAEGAFGAGAGCSVAKIGGLEHAWRGGQGIAVRRYGELVVGALVANNALGEVVAADGTPVLASRAPGATTRYPFADLQAPDANTVIGCIVTNARLTKHAAERVAELGHTGVARAVRPAHTLYDGDALFCLATGRVDASSDVVAHLAIEAVEEATRRGPLHATSLDGLPGHADHAAP
ncbi:MAG TPA: P1 family peptidase [Nitriliruptorales bacterium]